MRRSLIAASVVLGGLVLSAGMALAQDPAKVAADIYNCTFENERVRVCEVTIKPGGKVPQHSHPDHLVYVLGAGKLRITKASGSTDSDLKKGQVLWIPAETHTGENAGTTELKALVVELKK